MSKIKSTIVVISNDITLKDKLTKDISEFIEQINREYGLRVSRSYSTAWKNSGK